MTDDELKARLERIEKILRDILLGLAILLVGTVVGFLLIIWSKG